MKAELSKTYNPQEAESRWYNWWEAQGYFKADNHSTRPAFVIVMPPPNVTGSLHMGHLLNNTVHDVIVRRKRMQGFNTLWLPGMDHAGIATQNVVEKELAKQRLTRHDLGREKFVERVWEWKKQYGGIILKQIRRIGASCDWSRERFTFDEGLSRAVREVFVRLYEEGLIYRGKRLINWCPRCLTALSDLEVKHEPADAKLYYIRYPLSGRDGFVTVATTRPETMLGDTAVAIHPDDKRYQAFKGTSVIVPLVGREVPFIEDQLVDPKFGTGVVKVTPAHDPADFEMGERHGLPQIGVIGEDARITEAGGPYAGMDRMEARRRILSDLEEQGLLEKTENLHHSVSQCSRCGTIVEPLLSTQWFVRIKPLADAAIAAVESGRTQFVPANWAKTYYEWMYNIRDWCISRQLWWGHRIPAWYCSCGEMIVSRTDVTACSKCGSKELHQDQDVLDTWFSSGLWPFSTLGWPDETDDLKAFYPGTLLVTAYDIIFFWVARMIMFGLKFMNDVPPFQSVYITGLVRDAEKQKMSKSKGNAVDPLEVCDKYGTDAVRFALARAGAPGADISWSDDLPEGYRAFATKIWNAARFIFRNIDESDRLPVAEDLRKAPLSLADRWILSRLARATENINTSLDKYNLHEASRHIYNFFWHEFCDWYIEMTKLHPESSKPVLIYILENALRLLHPFMPFITEELWQNLPHRGDSIVIATYPEFDSVWIDAVAETQISAVQDIIVKVRNIRSEMNVEAKQAVSVRIVTVDPAEVDLLSRARPYVLKLAQADRLDIVSAAAADKLSARAVAAGMTLEVPLAGLIDINAERVRLNKELEKVHKEIDVIDRKLSNASFVERAPVEVVEEQRRRMSDYRFQGEKLKESLARLG